MLQRLRAFDDELVELPCGRGSVLIPPLLQGRIFCQLDGDLVHRLDPESLAPSLGAGYINAGGNSLWPAPEGGPFAFNYLPDSDEWVVQDGIGTDVPLVSSNDARGALVYKHLTLINRKGVVLDLGYRRFVTVPKKPPAPKGYRLHGLSYRTVDVFEPMDDYLSEDALLAPWSLEQFPGAEGIVAFGKVTDATDAINYDFYDHPGDRVVQGQGQFTFRLGGEVRHQIGVKTASQPQFIGAIDPERSLLIVRKAEAQSGIYFNIADNAQSDGPFSASDLYSIFNGGSLGFFELETIGAMNVEDGRLGVSSLSSETLVLRGDLGELLRYLREEEGVTLEGLI